MRRWFLPRRARFLSGVVCGMLLVVAGRWAINKTSVADWIVGPLLVADTGGKADAIVVPGAGVIGECVPNHYATGRVRMAVRLWRQQRAPVIVFSGGTGGSCPVAEAMAHAAVEMGVPADSIRLERASRSTQENAELSAPLLRGWGAERLLLVTDRLHMKRVTAVFSHFGFKIERGSVPIYEGHEDNVSMLHAGLREYAALAYYTARGWIGAHAAGVTSAPAELPGGVGHAQQSGPLVILGASYAEGWKPATLGGVPVVNRGVAGQQSFEYLARFERDVVPARPRAVILWGFINDIYRAPAGELDQSLSRVRDSYTKMIALARKHGIEPILATEVTARPRSETVTDRVTEWVAGLLGKSSYQDQVNHHVLAMNDWLIELGKQEKLLVLPFQAMLAEPGGRRHRRFAQPDGSHITAAGYDVLTTFANPVLEDFFGTP